jgi:hypothetical protein
VAVLLGDKHRFAVQVGDYAGELRRVDMWAADQYLTCDDNTAYVPHFRHAVRDTAVWVRNGHSSPLPFAALSPATAHRRLRAAREYDDDVLWNQFRIFDCWGPTTDNFSAFLFRDGDQLVITVQFWREEHLLKHPEHVGTVFAVEIQAAEFAGILEDLAAVLDRGQGVPAIR